MDNGDLSVRVVVPHIVVIRRSLRLRRQAENPEKYSTTSSHDNLPFCCIDSGRTVNHGLYISSGIGGMSRTLANRL